MAYRALRTSVNLPTTVRALPSGVPHVPHIRVNCPSPLAANDHHAHDGAHGPRADTAPQWTSRTTRATSAGLIARTVVNGKGFERWRKVYLESLVADSFHAPHSRPNTPQPPPAAHDVCRICRLLADHWCA